MGVAAIAGIVSAGGPVLFPAPLRATGNRDDVGDSGYGIPYNVEKEKIEIKDSSAKFVVAIETGGMFDRLGQVSS